MNFFDQREMVAGSLLMDEQREHRHDAPSSRTGYHARPAESGRDRVSAVPSRNTPSHAPRPATTGRDGQGAAPTRDCPRCAGEGEVHSVGQSLHPTAGVYVDDPQTETTIPCRACAGTGVVPVAVRRIPNTRRGM